MRISRAETGVKPYFRLTVQNPRRTVFFHREDYSYFYNMSKNAIQNFESALKKSFNKYLKQKPAQDDSFDGAMKRILWMKDTVQKVNEESALLIKEHASDNEDLKKEMQAISLEQTKKIMLQLKG